MMAKPAGMKETEQSFRKAAIQWLKIRFGRNIWHYRTPGGLGHRPGVPDDLFCINGTLVAVEFKSPNGTGRVHPRQAMEIAQIIEAKGVAGIVSSWSQLEELVKQFEPVQRGFVDRKGERK
jgi:hypothetical protein